MISENELNNEIIERRTYISPSLRNGLRFTRFSLKLDEIVEIYQESLIEIHNEYQNYKDTASEIAYSFSSPTFKVLLYNWNYFSETQNPFSIKRPMGYPLERYDNSTNYLFLEFGEFVSSNDMESFKISLKGSLRHRFHFASKNILHAPFPKRPEIRNPCEIITAMDYPLDENLKPINSLVLKFTQRYDSIVSTDQILKPTFPFREKQKKFFTDSLFEDVGNLKQAISNDPELRHLIHRNYKPMRWTMSGDALKNYPIFSEKAVIDAELMGKRFCMELISGIGNNAMKRNFCIDERYMQEGKMYLEGYSVSDTQFVEDAFIHDVNWLIYSALFQNDVRNSNYHGKEAQLDGWLYRIPQDIYRRAFPLLEKIRVKDFNKFSLRAQTLGQCNDNTDPSNIKRCIKNICKNDFILESFLKHNLNKFKEQMKNQSNCDYSDDECFIRYIKKSIILNMQDPEFVKTLDTNFMENDSEFQKFDKSITLEKFNRKPGFTNILTITTELHLLLAGMFAFREEIGHILGKIIDKTYLTYLRRFPNHPGFNLKPKRRQAFETKFDTAVENFDSNVMYSLTDMQLRSKFDSLITIFYDVLYQTKDYVKKKNQEQILNAKMNNEVPPRPTFKNTCKNICIGTFRSVAFIGWKYCAGPIIMGTKEVFSKVKKGYREGGVLSSLDMGLEAIAEHFIPGGEALLTMQKELHLEYENRENQKMQASVNENNIKLQSKLRKQEIKKRRQETIQLMNESNTIPVELKALADKINTFKKEREELQKQENLAKQEKLAQETKKKKDHIKNSLIVDRSEVEKLQKEEEQKRALEMREQALAKEKLMAEKQMERLKKQEELSQKHMIFLKEQEPFDKLRTEIEVMSRAIDGIEKSRLKLEELFTQIVRSAMVEKIVKCQNLLFQNQFSSRTQRIIEQRNIKENNQVLLPGAYVKGEFVPHPYDVSPNTLAFLFKSKKILLKKLRDFTKKFNNERKPVAWDKYEILSQSFSVLSKIFLKCQEQNKELSILFETLNKLEGELSTQFDLLSKDLATSSSVNEQKLEMEGEPWKKELTRVKKTRAEQISEKRQRQLDFKRTKNEARKRNFFAQLQGQGESLENAIPPKNSIVDSHEVKSNAELQYQSGSKSLQEFKNDSENLTLAYSEMNGVYGDQIYYSSRTSALIFKINQEIKTYLDDMSEILKVLGESADNSTSGISRVLANLNLDSKQKYEQLNIDNLPRFNGNAKNELEKFAIKSEILAFIYLTSCIMEKIKNSPIRHFFPRQIARQFRDAVYHNSEFRSILVNDRDLKHLIEQRDYMRNLALELVSYMRARLARLNMTQEQAAFEIAKLSSLIFKNHEHMISKRGFISNRRNACKRKMKECIAYLKLAGLEHQKYCIEVIAAEIAKINIFPNPLQKLISSYAEERVLTWYFGERANTILSNSFALILGEFGSYFKEYSRRHYKDKEYSFFESEISPYDPEMINRLRHAQMPANADADADAVAVADPSAAIVNPKAIANSKDIANANSSSAKRGSNSFSVQFSIVPQFAKHKATQASNKDLTEFTTYSDLRKRTKGNASSIIGKK